MVTGLAAPLRRVGARSPLRWLSLGTLLFAVSVLVTWSGSAAAQRRPDFLGNPVEAIVSLAGPWRVVTEPLTPEQALEADIEAWESMVLPSSRPGNHEVVWFGADVQLTGPAHWNDQSGLALLLPPFVDAYEAFANGRLIGRRGAPPPEVKWGPYRASVFPLEPQDLAAAGLVRLRVRVWPHGWGNIGTQPSVAADSLGLGPRAWLEERSERLHRRAVDSYQYRSASAWVLAGLALVFLAFATRVRGQREYLYLTIFVLGVAVDRLLSVRFAAGIADDPRALWFVALTLKPPIQAVLVLLVTSLFGVRTRVSRAVVILVAATTVVPIAAGIANGGDPALVWGDRIALGASVGYLLVVVIRGARRRDPDARLLATGFGAALVAIAFAVVLLAQLSAVSPWHLAVDVLIDVALGLFVGVMALVLARRQQRSREQLAASFAASQRFVPYDFLALLGRRNITEVERADSTALEMGILFADIRGFTTLCEKRSTEENFAFVNRYLERTEPAIVGEGGFIHQYLGDGIVALFPGGGCAALRCALRMQQAVRAFNDEIQSEGGEPIRIGIGVHHDRVMLGTIGGREQLDAGVISDGMNLTARIESLTKTYHASVLVSDAVAGRVEGEALREIDSVIVKGRSASVVLLQALGALDEAERAAIDATADDFAQGLAAYRRGEFQVARDAFVRCSDDPCAALMAERSARFAEAPPSSWRGVTRLEHK